MVGVTCEKCGATYRFDDADVPPSGKIIKCARCGTAITVMPAGADAMGMKTPAGSAPARTVFGLGPQQEPVKAPAPAASGMKVPGPTARKPASPAGDEVSWDDISASDLVSLGRNQEDEELDLVAPVGPTPTRRPDDRQAPDLLAPVGPTPTRRRPPGAAESPPEIADLPAPVGPTSKKQAALSEASVPDLLAPVGPLPKRNVPDLLTPVGPTSKKKAPAATPMPAATAPTVPGPMAEPPAPAPGQARRKGPSGDVPDLPAPVGPLPTKQLPDLLTPVGPLPTKGVDLPAPKGFFDDGLQPSRSGSSAVGLPAPKGFFDDGLQPKREGDPTAATQPGLDPTAGRTVVGTGKPAPAPAARAVSGGAAAARTTPGDPAAEKLAFDVHDSIELGDSFLSPAPSTGPSRPFGLDTGDLEFTMERTGNSAPTVPIDLDDALPGSVARTGGAAPHDSGFDLGMPDAIELDLAGPDPGPQQQTSGVTFGRPVSGPVAKHTGAVPVARKADPFAPERSEGLKSTTELSLDLDRPGGAGATAPALSAPGKPMELATPVKRPVKKVAEAKPARGRRRSTILLAAALGVVALGAGGWFAWTKWQGSQTRKDSSSRGLKKAETLLSDDAGGHWERAAAEAQRVLSADPDNGEALALIAEANFAAVLDESVDVQARTEKGDKAIEKLRKAKGKGGPHAAKAEALRALLSTSFEAAIKKLDPLRDGDARLYLGWALAAHEQHDKAVQAFGAAIAKKPKRIPAHYGLGLAKLELGAHDDARKAFQAAIDASRDRFKRDHLGALIGLAQLAPVGEREDRYQELLNRPDLAKEPPRAVSRLKALAGDEAMRAGRLDQGKALYEEARALDQLNLRAQVGVAVFAARTGDLPGARKRLGEVLAMAPNHIEAALALGGVAVAEGKLDEAIKLADGLLARSPPVTNPIMVARVHLARAAAFEASADRAVQEKAEIEYREAMKRADPGDFTAAVRLSILLTRLGKAKDAVEVLQPVKAAAQKDPDLSITLGGAYLAAGNGAAAAEAFQSALQRRPDDLEARFQLGQAQFMQGKHDQAIDTLRAAIDKDTGREDIGLALARMLAARGRIKDAAQVYDKLLAGKPSLTVRARAGRFFAGEGMHDKAMVQGEAIRGESPRNPTGLFLLGEKLLAEKKHEEAQRAYRDAARLEPEAQYFEALARAAEKLGQLDEALRQFGRAIEVDPAYMAPRLGRARIRLLRREYALAIDELKAAQELDANAATVLRDLGRAYLAMRDVKTAVPLLERSLQAAAGDPEAHFLLGQAYFDLDRAREAAGQLARAVQLGKEDATWRAEAYRMLGYASRSANNNRAALDAWRRYLELDQKDSAQRRDVQRLILRLEAN
jgi:predicted Zn finger-like uncharacterized protein